MPESHPFEVVSYSRHKLIHLLSKYSEAPPDVVEGKYHLGYLDGYFQELQAKTIIVEKEYFDRDYLEDFSAYYVRCFRDYKRRCARLHFFASDFDQNALIRLLEKEKSRTNIEKLQDSYLGFVVVRPLPFTIIGRTCLKTYPLDNGRSFPTTRRYKANLFGIRLDVESLAFQEQDKSVAVCATSALWSAFHKTGMLFQHPIPSPVDITKAAFERFPGDSRAIPPSSLTTEQMAGSVRSVGLEPFMIEDAKTDILKDVLYAYVSARIPVLLLFDLFERADQIYRLAGKHAVTVTGFCLEKHEPSATGANLRSRRISKIYVHDDQVGPFARMGISESEIEVGKDKIQVIGTAWSEYHKARPEHVLVPLYHKIRIPFPFVYESIIPFASAVSHFGAQGRPGLPGQMEWDIRLTSLNDFRQELLEGNLKGSNLRQVLCDSYPRFLWRTTFRIDDVPGFDLLFDATDIQQGKGFLKPIIYHPPLGEYLKGVFQNTDAQRALLGKPAMQIVDWLLS